MAIILNNTVTFFSSPYRPLCWDVTSTDPATVKLLVKHSVNVGVVATTFHLPTIGTTDNFVIDASNIASNFVTYDIADDYGLSPITFNSEVLYQVSITELDVDGNQLSTTIPQNTYVQNIPLQHNDVQDLNEFALIDNTSCILSKRGVKSTVYRGELIPINTLSSFTTPHIKIEGTASGVFQSGSVLPLSVLNNRGVFYLDTDALFSDVVDGFTVQLFDDAIETTEISKEYTFKLKQKCDDYCEVHFLNCLGGFDSFMFTGDKSTKFNVNRKRFKGSIGKGFNVKDRGQSVLGTKSLQEIELFSRFLNESESAMLSDLIHSPEVFIIENNKFIPVVVKDGSYTTKSSKGLIQYKVVLEYANNKIVACV